MCGKYKDKEKYLEVSIGIVDDLTKMIVEILSISSFQEIKEKKEILKLKDEVNNILKNYEVLIKEKNITIPMLPLGRSLNLSNAVAIILYEALKQVNFEFE